MGVSFSEKVFKCFNYIFIALLSFSFLYPFWRIIILSLNDGTDARRGGIYFLPRLLTFDNYLVILSKPDITSAYQVTISRTVLGTLLSLIVSMLMAYGLSKKGLKGTKLVNIMMLITLYFSGGLIPVYLLYRELGLFDSIWVYIVPALYNAWNIILFRTFFKTLPPSLEESAKIDGANDLIVFFRIVLSLSMPIIATIALFTAVTHWNDWYAGTVYVSRRNLIPLQTLLMRVINDNSSMDFLAASTKVLTNKQKSSVTSNSIKMATLVITTLPIICVYPFLQKYFAKGVLVGSIKG